MSGTEYIKAKRSSYQYMDHMSYNRVRSGKVSSESNHRSFRGFRISPRKLYVLRLRKRFSFFLRLFHSWKLSYCETLQMLKKVICRKNGLIKRSNSNSSRRSLVREEEIKGHSYFRMRSYGRSNSFYAEAIADCLEFIKRTSISSIDQIQGPISHTQDRI